MGQTRLSIDVHKGLLEVEGEEAFVRTVYEDFRDRLVASNATRPPAPEAKKPSEEMAGEVPLPSNRKQRRRQSKTADSGTKPASYKEQFLNDLDTRGLREFYAQYATKNHSEKVLVFCRFLSDEKGIVPCSFNHIYTCYKTLRERMPKVFVQAIRDTQSKHHFISYTNYEDVQVTIPGDNHFDHDMVRATPAAAE